MMKTTPSTVERGRGKNKHFWTLDEDGALLESLHEIYRDPNWRGDSGFRSGYAAHLETMLKNKLPGCALKASPHIESRIKLLKMRYFALTEMLCHKGFDWDDKRSMLICDKNVYDEWLKTHKDANGLYGKPFLNYHTLKEIYGNERSNGVKLRGFDNNKDREDLEVNVETQADEVFEDFEVSFTQQPSSKRRKSAGNSPSVSNHDRKVKNKVMEEMGKSFGNMASSMATMAQKLDGLVKVWSKDREVADMQSRLDNELTKIEGLSELQVFRATNILATKHDLLRVFFSMSRERKRSYVFNLVQFGL